MAPPRHLVCGLSALKLGVMHQLQPCAAVKRDKVAGKALAVLVARVAFPAKKGHVVFP